MRAANDSFEAIRKEILRAGTVLLAGHTNPDGDAIGACLAFAGALEKSGGQGCLWKNTQGNTA